MSLEFPSTVLIREEGAREGFQFEKGQITTARKIELLDALSETGLTEIQAASFVNPKLVPGWSDAEAVAAGLKMKPEVSYTGFYMNEYGLRRAIATERLTIRGSLFVTASPKFLHSNTGWTPEAELDRAIALTEAYRQNEITVTEIVVMAAFGCNFFGDIGTETVLWQLERMFEICEQGQHGGQQVICLADTMAWATPLAVKHLVANVRERWPTNRIALHLHDTRGLAIANAYAGLEVGVDSFDAAVAGLGGCPFAKHYGAAGNICTEDLAFLCQELGIETGIDIDKMCEVGRLAEEIVGHSLPGRLKQSNNLASLRRGQGLGGVRRNRCA